MTLNQVFSIVAAAVLGGLLTTGCAPRPIVGASIEQPLENRLEWKLPAGWQVRYSGDGARYGSLITPNGAEVVITRFPGDLGDDLSNINRWRGQLGLEAVATGQMERLGATGNVRLAWITDEINNKTLVAAIMPAEGSSFAFRLETESNKAQALKEDILAFLQSLEFAKGAHNHE